MGQSLTRAVDGFVAQYAAVDGTAPAVLVFSGSAGGHPGSAYLPALRGAGFNGMALSYFGAPGLPGDLHEIPLEYFHDALTWLRAQPNVDPAQVFLMARSRGTEAAQLVALHWPSEVAGLVLGVPSYVVVRAWPRDGAAWTLGGEALPFHPHGWPTDGFPLDPPAAIPLERFPGPVMLVSGGKDSTWPSSAFATVIAKRRAAVGRITELRNYPEAGHAVGVLCDPCDGSGDPSDVAARVDVWPRVLAFLRRSSAARL